MPYSNITAPAQIFQDTFLIPSKDFSQPFQQVLNNISGIITSTERKLLSLMERYCYLDGAIYPKRSSIAFKLGIKPRQVSNLIKSLTGKGFISVVAASLVDRHCYGKGNQYHLLNHPAYPNIAPQIAPEIGKDTLLKNYKDIKTKGGFDILSWLKNNNARHEKSIVDALKELTRRWPKIKFPWMYVQKVVDIQSGNYNAQDHEAQAKQEAKEITQGTAKLAGLMGLSMKRISVARGEQDTPEKRNRMRNEFLNQFE